MSRPGHRQLRGDQDVARGRRGRPEVETVGNERNQVAKCKFDNYSTLRLLFISI